jgi:hypothetical protein
MRLLLFSLLIFPHFISAQTNCFPQTSAFKAGEQIQYDVKYNWGLLWVDAGEVSFMVDDTIYNNQKAYWFKGYGRSKPKWDWVFKVRDSFDAVGTITQLKPLYFRRNTREGSYLVDNEYWYNHQQKNIKAKVYNSDSEETKYLNVPLNECIWDLLSAVFYARNLDYETYAINAKIPFNLIIEGKVNNLFVRYLGREVLEMPSGKKYKTIKFSALLVDGTIFAGGEDMTVWVTDDRNKIPLKVEAKIQVGWVKAFLTSTKGLKYDAIQPIAD